MNVLLSFVGEQDPYSDKTGEEGSIVTLCRQIKPQIIYLFPTATGFGVKSETQSRAVDTQTWITSEIDSEVRIYIRPLPLNDPTDYSLILPLVRRAVAGVMRELQQIEGVFHLNCSSGTPQLKSTWLILANAGVLKDCQLWQVANPLFNKDNRVSKLEVTFLEEENLLIRVKRYTEEFLFQRMAEECDRLKEISLYSYRKEKAALLARIFRAYQSWDLIRYEDAYKRLNSAYNEVRSSTDLAGLTAVLQPQTEVLARLKDITAEENKYNLVDLYINARRRLARSDYTDTLSRFWRIYEGTLFRHMRKFYKIEPGDLSNSIDKTRLKAIFDAGYFHPGLKTLSIATSSKVLMHIFKDKTYKKVMEKSIKAKRGPSEQSVKLIDLLDELREKRNESIVAHGMKPVEQDDAANCIRAAEVILKGFIPDTVDLIEYYPLELRQLLKVIEVLDTSFNY